MGVVQLGESLVFVLGLRVLANWLVKLFGEVSNAGLT